MTSGFPDVTEHTATMIYNPKTCTPRVDQSLDLIWKQDHLILSGAIDHLRTHHKWRHMLKECLNHQDQCHISRIDLHWHDRQLRPWQVLAPRFNPVSIGPTFMQTRPTVSPPHEIPSTSYFVDPHMRQYPRLVNPSKSTTHNPIIHIQIRRKCLTNNHLLFITQYCRMMRLER